MTQTIFLTATGTDVGKTFITALLIKQLRRLGYNAGYYKAVLSGAILTANGLVAGDADYVCRIAGLAENPNDLVSFIYQHAVSPHLAARLENSPPTLAKICADYQKIALRYDYLIVEGSGGAICPLRYEADEKIFLTDVMRVLALPTVIVAPAGLGTLNATTLTVHYLRSQQIPIRGIILNRDRDDLSENENRRILPELTGLPILATVAEAATAIAITPEQLYG